MPAPFEPLRTLPAVRPLRGRFTLAVLLIAAPLAALPVTAASSGDPALLAAGPTPPRSRLYVVVPGYEDYLATPPGVASPPAPAVPPPPPVAVSPRTPAAPAIASPVIPAPAVPPPVIPAPAHGAEHGAVPASPETTPASLAMTAADPPLASIGFQPGETALPRQAEPSLAALATDLQRQPTMVIALAGFADQGASDAVTARRRALWRARAVRTHLLNQGIAADRIRLDAEAAAGGAATERVDVRIVQP